MWVFGKENKKDVQLCRPFCELGLYIQKIFQRHIGVPDNFVKQSGFYEFVGRNCQRLKPWIIIFESDMASFLPDNYVSLPF